MLKAIDRLEKEFLEELARVGKTADVEELRVRFLGKKGPVQDLMQLLRDIRSEERPQFGKRINELKQEIHSHLAGKQEELVSKEETEQLAEEVIDIGLPGEPCSSGRKHIIAHVLDRMLDILVGMGFSVEYGPDIDTDYYNFESLNFPDDHPARDMQDTFYITSDMLLRTHTSNTQTRIMQQQTPPIRVTAPGKVYRNETITARSHVFFHQVEAFYIDKTVTFADLQETMRAFCCAFFEREVSVRFRPSYFPFVEPGLELDVGCLTCEGTGCPLCKHTGWLEVAGAGMIHPEVLKSGSIDPEEYSGYAWGMGVERMAMLLYKVRDIRLFTENHLRFLSQFSLA